MPQTGFPQSSNIMSNEKVRILHFAQTRRSRPINFPESQIQHRNPEEPDFFSRRVYRKLKRREKPNDLAREVGFMLKRTKKTAGQQAMQEEDQYDDSNSENPMLIEDLQ